MKKKEFQLPYHWSYYCESCDFAAHPFCVFGNHPSVKFGCASTGTSHQQPVTLGQKTEDAPPCDACETDFSDLQGVEFSHCKVNLPTNCFCLSILADESDDEQSDEEISDND